jgi:hypothetical protein
MSGLDVAVLRHRAMANPRGPEALRLAWLQSRAVGSPRRSLLELISRYLDQRFSIREIDNYIDEQLARAQGLLWAAHERESMPARKLHALEETIEMAVFARRARPAGLNAANVVVHALETAYRLDEESAAAS